MKRNIRKTDLCLNCGYDLSLADNYCPQCGQRNDDNNLTFWEMVKEFFSNYFSFDSKFGKSIRPFFLQPGKLTNQFNEGKRVSYVNPIRLYIIISFIYFLVVGLVISKISTDELIGFSDNEEQINPNQSINSEGRNENLKVILESKPKEDSTAYIEGERSDYKQAKSALVVLYEYAKVDSISNQALLDSLGISTERDAIASKSVLQIRKMMRQPSYFIDFLVTNLPVMMFIILPIFALMLKIFYWRSKTLYIKHLVHALHLHSFAFLIFALCILVLNYFSSSGWIGLSSFLLVVVYSVISFKKVYYQSWGKTILKFLLFGFSYYWLLFFGLIAEFAISFFLF